MTKEHSHPINSKIPYDRAKQVLANHLCGWITGHGAPEGHFDTDAEQILSEMHEAGIRFHLLGHTSNNIDGFFDFFATKD